MEWRESDLDYRFTLYIIRSPSFPGLFWKLEGQMGTSGSDPIDWTVYNTSVPVPVGSWFLLEAY